MRYSISRLALIVVTIFIAAEVKSNPLCAVVLKQLTQQDLDPHNIDGLHHTSGARAELKTSFTIVDAIQLPKSGRRQTGNHFVVLGDNGQMAVFSAAFAKVGNEYSLGSEAKPELTKIFSDGTAFFFAPDIGDSKGDYRAEIKRVAPDGKIDSNTVTIRYSISHWFVMLQTLLFVDSSGQEKILITLGRWGKDSPMYLLSQSGKLEKFENQNFVTDGASLSGYAAALPDGRLVLPFGEKTLVIDPLQPFSNTSVTFLGSSSSPLVVGQSILIQDKTMDTLIYDNRNHLINVSTNLKKDDLLGLYKLGDSYALKIAKSKKNAFIELFETAGGGSVVYDAYHLISKIPSQGPSYASYKEVAVYKPHVTPDGGLIVPVRYSYDGSQFDFSSTNLSGPQDQPANLNMLHFIYFEPMQGMNSAMHKIKFRSLALRVEEGQTLALDYVNLVVPLSESKVVLQIPDHVGTKAMVLDLASFKVQQVFRPQNGLSRVFRAGYDGSDSLQSLIVPNEMGIKTIKLK